MCGTRLAENAGRKISSQKSQSMGTISQLCRAIIATKAPIDNRKKLVKQQYYVLEMCPQHGEHRPTNG